MSARVTDYEVERWLVWARNYGEIENFDNLRNAYRKGGRVAGVGGRRWVITLPDPPGIRPITASGLPPGMTERSIVPEEFVLTSREALAFGMGAAVAGSRPETRAAFAAREWKW